MAEIKLKQINSLYGELAGLLSQLPLAEKSRWVSKSTGDLYNSTVDELIKLSGTEYSRLKLSDGDTSEYSSNDDDFDTANLRVKLGALVKRLEEEYGFNRNASTGNSAPVIVTVNQNQEVTLTVTPIQQIIDSTDDSEVRKELNELKTILETTKDPEKTSGILNKIQKISWEVFIKVLPIVLEQLGKRAS